jgi:hypothetical protein
MQGGGQTPWVPQSSRVSAGRRKKSEEVPDVAFGGRTADNEAGCASEW